MGLYVDFSERNTLSNNRVSDNAGFQIFLDYSGSNRVEANTVSGGTEQGVYLYDADNCTISGNTVRARQTTGSTSRPHPVSPLPGIPSSTTASAASP